VRKNHHYNYLKSCRKKLGLTQRQLAFVIGLETGSRISVLEKGAGLPTLREAVMFERLFGRDLRELWPRWASEVEQTLEDHVRQLRDGLARHTLRSIRKQQRTEFLRRQLAIILRDAPEE
jgi:transcriptional regulator with XRE-family HTH domain